MADNIAITAGSGTPVAADDVSGVYHQRVKLSLGPDGTANDAEAGAGAVDTGTMRVTLASDDPAVTALQVIDDWDESDRAKVNPIVGQAGVAAGAGAVGSTTQRVTLASDDPGVAHLAAIRAAPDHETVAASQTDQMLGSTGAAGDKLYGMLVVPASTSPGEVSIEYGSTNIIVFAGGSSSVSNLVPFWVELGGIASVGGGWEVTTGADVSVIAVGDFT